MDRRTGYKSSLVPLKRNKHVIGQFQISSFREFFKQFFFYFVGVSNLHRLRMRNGIDLCDYGECDLCDCGDVYEYKLTVFLSHQGRRV